MPGRGKINNGSLRLHGTVTAHACMTSLHTASWGGRSTGLDAGVHLLLAIARCHSLLNSNTSQGARSMPNKSMIYGAVTNN